MKYGSRKRFLAAAALPFALAVAGCGDQGDDDTIASTTTPTVSTVPAPDTGQVVVDSTPAAADTTSGGLARPAPSAPAPGDRSTNDAVFTAVQADRGQANFQQFCTSCHTATDFRGSHFLQNWGTRTVGDLYEFISTNMPMDAPGSLEANQYAEIIAYFLRQNNYPAGSSALPAAEATLRQIRFASPAVTAGN